MPTQESWKVAPGDPNWVCIQGVAKPINCGSQARARMIASAPETAAERDRLRALNAELIGELKNAAAADEFYRHETSRSAYLREFAVRARAAIVKAKE